MKKLTNWLLNPFTYIAGWQSAVIGFVVYWTTCFIASFNSVFFPDVLSLKMGMPQTMSALLLQGITNWVVLAILLYTAGRLFSRSKPRFIDVIGTQGLARFPYLLASLLGFSDATVTFGQHLMFKHAGIGSQVDITSGTIVFAVVQIILMILATVWMVVLMYRAFSVSANLKGAKAVWVFIGTLILAIVITAIFFSYVINSNYKNVIL